MTDSLVATKLLPPWAHRPAVPRPHLVARLRAGLDGPLTLLCAPAGFGKTSLALQSLDGYGAAAARPAHRHGGRHGRRATPTGGGLVCGGDLHARRDDAGSCNAPRLRGWRP